MYNKTAYGYGSNRSVIRELFEYGNRRAAIVGRENIFDYSLGRESLKSTLLLIQYCIIICLQQDILWLITARRIHSGTMV